MKETPLTKVHAIYPELMLSSKGEKRHKGWSKKQLMELKYCVEQFKRSLVRTCSHHCNFGLYTLTFHLLDKVLEDLQAFGTPSVLDASPFA